MNLTTLTRIMDIINVLVPYKITSNISRKVELANQAMLYISGNNAL